MIIFLDGLIYLKNIIIILKKMLSQLVICLFMIAKTMLDLFFMFYTPVKPTKIFKKDEEFIYFVKKNIIKV